MDIFSYKLGKNSGGGSSGGIDWSKIGYAGTPQALQNAYLHAKDVYNNYVIGSKMRDDMELIIAPLVDTSSMTTMKDFFHDTRSLLEVPPLNTSNATSMASMCYYCIQLRYVHQLDTSNVDNMSQMFYQCSNLTTIPIFDTSKVTNMKNMFIYCPKLDDQSVDNILVMCINSLEESKTLSRLGLTSTNYPVSRIEALPHYQEFLNAGWTIGY